MDFPRFLTQAQEDLKALDRKGDAIQKKLNAATRRREALDKTVGKLNAQLVEARERLKVSMWDELPTYGNGRLKYDIRSPAISRDKLRRQTVQDGMEWLSKYWKDADQLNEVVVMAERGRRSYHSGGWIYISKHRGTSVVVHEVAHAMEYHMPRIYKAAKDFLDARTVGEVAQKLQKLMPRNGYKAREIAKPDKFYDPYVGKIYGDSSTEITTMGFQALYEDPVRFLQNDPEHFLYSLRILMGIY